MPKAAAAVVVDFPFHSLVVFFFCQKASYYQLSISSLIENQVDLGLVIGESGSGG